MGTSRGWNELSVVLLITNGATVALKGSEPSVGAFPVTVYDYFGTLSIALWGEHEILCAQATVVLHDTILQRATFAEYYAQ
jgi:hypothetical protein